MLDEEVLVPKGSSTKFFNKFTTKHKEHPRLTLPKNKPVFIFKHYAGDVVYDPALFLEKNRDPLYKDIEDLCKDSSVPLVSALFAPAKDGAGESKDAGGGGRRGGKKASSKMTVSGHFCAQLDSLMETLYATNPHYVRCIKPNDVKKPLIFEDRNVLDQLKFSGIFEAVTIRKSGFPFRRFHAQFRQRYRMIAPRGSPAAAAIAKCTAGGGGGGGGGGGLDKDACKALLDYLTSSDAVLYEPSRLGSSRVLYQAPQHKALEQWRAAAIDVATRTCQRYVKGHQGRTRSREIRAIGVQLRGAMEARSLDLMEVAVRHVQLVVLASMHDVHCLLLK